MGDDVSKYKTPVDLKNGTVTASGNVGLENTSDTRINPATEDTLTLVQTDTTALTGALESNDTDTVLTNATDSGPWSNIFAGTENATTAGTRMQLNGGVSLAVPDGGHVLITPPQDNTDDVVIGNSSVTTDQGYHVSPGDRTTIPVDDVSKVHYVAENANEELTWLVVTD